MQTEAGKIQGAVWGWGALSGYDVKWGNYDIDDAHGSVPKWGTDEYKDYMHSLMKENPGVFPDHLEQLPETNLTNLEDHPQEAVFTYLRGECQRCHVGVNGEGRITPIIPGCQQITTVIGEDGEVLVSNKIWRTPGGMENSDENGQRGIDMTPAQPHTVSAKSRECTSCHTNPKILGYGVEEGEFMQSYEEDNYKDLQTVDGQNLGNKAKPQFPKIEDLPMDLSQVVTRDGKQVQTVGHHWPLSGPLSQYSREKMERVGVCISCHQDVPDGNIFIKATTAAGEVLGLVPHHDHEHMKLLNMDIKWAAMTRIFMPILIIIIFVLAYYTLRIRKRLKNPNS